MKITDVKTVLLTGPCTNDPYLLECRKLRSAAFIEIHTDTELLGLGETYAGYFCPEMVPQIVEFFKPILVGQNVDNIDELWQRMYSCGNFWCRVGLGVIVMNGIEAALWDLKGKAEGKPVYELLGGLKRERLLGYATGGPSNYPKKRLAEKIDHYLGLGFSGFKISVGSFTAPDDWYIPMELQEAVDFESDKMEFVRQHAGPDINVMYDGHMGNSPGAVWDVEIAKAVCKVLEPYNLFFFEEPLHYTDPWGYAELCKSTSIPIAGGECLTAFYEWKVFAEKDCFDIGQPDASFTGGLTEFVRIANLLEQRGRKIATHAWGAGGSLMQNIHAGFACANTAVLEVAPDFAGLHSEVIDGSFFMDKGDVLPPDKPGLGIILTDETKNRYPFVPGSGEFNSVPGKVLVD
jgi:L-alanine-DL-glutamate epimerase-like enolase superfamily enzyme